MKNQLEIFLSDVEKQLAESIAVKRNSGKISPLSLMKIHHGNHNICPKNHRYYSY